MLHRDDLSIFRLFERMLIFIYQPAWRNIHEYKNMHQNPLQKPHASYCCLQFCCVDYHNLESIVPGAVVWGYLESCWHMCVNRCSVATIYTAALNVFANTISALCSLLFLLGGRSKKGGGFATVSSSYKVRPSRSVLLVSAIARHADPISKDSMKFIHWWI